MPKVTDKVYQLEGFILEKLDFAVQRVQARKLDAIFVVDGDEGFGKTGFSILAAYYIAHKTGREFGLDQMFFDPKEFINYINSNTGKVIVWDEAALGGLASNWQNKVQQMLIQTLMTCRFRRHIIFFNVPKFYRLNQYFVGERATGLFHVYSEDKINAGQLTYYKKEWLEPMLNHWYKYRQQPYKKFYRKGLRGKFIDAFNPKVFKNGIIINENDYDNKKLHYTEKLLSQYGDSRHNEKLLRLQHSVANLKGIQKKEIALQIGVNQDTITNWTKIPSKYPEMFKELA